MSRQVNFFVHPLDVKGLHTWLLDEFAEQAVIGRVVGRSDELTPVPAAEGLPSPGAAAQQKVFLVPEWARDRVVTPPYTEREPAEAGQRVVRQRLSPILAYTPPIWEQPERKARVGRIYWQ